MLNTKLEKMRYVMHKLSKTNYKFGVNKRKKWRKCTKSAVNIKKREENLPIKTRKNKNDERDCFYSFVLWHEWKAFSQTNGTILQIKMFSKFYFLIE